MDSTEDLSTSSGPMSSVGDVGSASSLVAVQKLRGVLGDLSVHNGCARSHSTDSGFVTESDSTSHDSAEAVLTAEDMSTIPECSCGTENGTTAAADAVDGDQKSANTDSNYKCKCDSSKNLIPNGEHAAVMGSGNRTQLQNLRLVNHKLHRLQEEDTSRERSHSAPVQPRREDLSLDLTPVNVSSNASDSTEQTQCTTQYPTSTKQSWLLRLFESKLFDMNLAITYLYNSKEPGVQTYIGECTYFLIFFCSKLVF